jgi:Entner-Doudoroff aldolase
MSDFATLFGSNRIMVVLRGLPPADTVQVAEDAWDAGVELLEVPIGRPEQVPSLSAAVVAGRERGRMVGAGTVVTPEQVDTALDAGAGYTVSPGFDAAVLARSSALGLPHLPGVATPSEVQRAYAAGCRWMKAFPAIVLGPAWFRAIRGPFPDVRYVATGGIAATAASEYLDAGAQIVAVGAAFTHSDQRKTLIEVVNRYRAQDPPHQPPDLGSLPES